MEFIKDKTFDAERSLYALHGAEISNCVFDGPEDGESPLKECSEITVESSSFGLRYPFWHLKDSKIRNCTLTEACRAPLWYCNRVEFADCRIDGVKAFRECDGAYIEKCKINSSEFGWNCRGMIVNKTSVASEYPFFGTSDLFVDKLTLTGKYSFQYVKNSVICNSVLNTKDAFWHSKNVTVRDSEITGEYLGWYSENLRLVNCKISGTQPLCYAKGLVLENCELIGADFAFEKSDVTATLKGSVISIREPLSGSITLNSVGRYIDDGIGGTCVITQTDI